MNSEPNDERAQAAKRLLDQVETSGKPDAERAGAVALGLSKGPHGLRPEQIEYFTLAAEGSFYVSNSCRRAMPMLLDETGRDAVERRCGIDLDALQDDVDDADDPSKLIMTTCKLDPPPGPADRIHGWSVLVAAVIGDQLRSDPKSNEYEQTLAKKLVYLCAEDADPPEE